MSKFDKIIGYSAVKKELEKAFVCRKDQPNGDFVKVIKATFENVAIALAKKKLLSAVDIQNIKSECKIVPVAL